MASFTQGAVTYPRHNIAGRGGVVDRYFYFAMSLLIAVIVAWGFSHTIDEDLLRPVVQPPAILWFHAAAFTGWVAFFIFQSALVRTHNVKWHRYFGLYGATLGAIMVPLGLATAVIMARFETYRLHEKGRDTFLIIPVFGMIYFAVFLSLAIVWRKKPELHRRLIFIATCVLLEAAFGRIAFFIRIPIFGIFTGVDGLILLGVARDLIVNRRIHRVYLIALPILMICQPFVLYTHSHGSAWWLHIAHALMG